MLNVRIEPGESMDKALTSAASALKALLKASEQEGVVRIFAYPSLEAYAAGLLAFSALAREGHNVVLSLRPIPPSKIFEPSLAVGYDSLGYTNESVRSQLVAISAGLKEAPPVNASYISVDGSLGGSLYLVLRLVDDLKLEPEHAIMSLASLYASRYVDKSGKVFGVDKVLVNQLAQDNKVELTAITSLKSYRPHVLGFCESLSITLEPYYPGLAGSAENCEALLRSSALEELAHKRAIDMSDEDVKRLARAVLAFVKDRSGGRLQLLDYVGGFYVGSENLVVSDPREFLGVVTSVTEMAGLAQGASLAANFEEEYVQAAGRLGRIAKLLSETVEQGGAEELMVGGIKIVKLRAGRRAPLYYVWQAMRQLGLGEDFVLGYESEGKVVASLIQAAEALKSRLSKLIEQEGVSYRGAELWIAATTARQG